MRVRNYVPKQVFCENYVTFAFPLTSEARCFILKTMSGGKSKTVLLVLTVASCVLTLAFAITGEVLRGAVYGGTLPVAVNLAFGAAERLLLTVTAVCLMLTFGYTKALKPGISGGIIASVAGAAVAVANFPFVCMAQGLLGITASGGEFALFIVYCISVGLFEETAFRGFVFPLVLEKTGNKKYGVFIAVTVSSALFAILHLLNLAQGASVGATALQVGYTFLVGCMCSVIMIATGSLLVPVIVHAAFDVGGTMTSLGVAAGSHWNTPSIIIMAVVGTLAALYLAAWFFRHSDRALRLLPDREE